MMSDEAIDAEVLARKEKDADMDYKIKTGEIV